MEKFLRKRKFTASPCFWKYLTICWHVVDKSSNLIAKEYLELLFYKMSLFRFSLEKSPNRSLKNDTHITVPLFHMQHSLFNYVGHLEELETVPCFTLNVNCEVFVKINRIRFNENTISSNSMCFKNALKFYLINAKRHVILTLLLVKDKIECFSHGEINNGWESGKILR